MSSEHERGARVVGRRTALRTGATLVGSVLLGCGGAGTEADGGIEADGGGEADARLDESEAGLASRDGGSAPTERLQLPEGHFVPAKLSMVIVAPRPAEELGDGSAYRFAHEGVRYEVPIGVVGGAWPFTFELLEAPPGMTIGASLVRGEDTWTRPLDYGVVRWVPPAGSDGTRFRFRVRVTDQEGRQEEVTVDGEVDRERFVFVEPGDGGGAGNLDDPLRGFAELYRGSGDDATFAGRHVYFRGGEFSLAGDLAVNGGDVPLRGDTKPIVWRAYPDERPVFDCATAKIVFRGEMSDCAFIGLRFVNGRRNTPNGHFIAALGPYDRALFWRNEFVDLGSGVSGGTDNAAAIYANAPGRQREHVVFMSNRFEQLGAGVAGGYDTYAMDHALFEDNSAADSTSNGLFFLKGGHRNTTVRGERAVAGNVAHVILEPYLGQDGGTPASRSVEISYCAVANQSELRSARTLMVHRAGTADENRDIFVYRCTVVGPVGALHGDESELQLERCVLTTDEPPAGARITNVDHADVSESDLDGELRLIGDARAAYLGTHGVELA